MGGGLVPSPNITPYTSILSKNNLLFSPGSKRRPDENVRIPKFLLGSAVCPEGQFFIFEFSPGPEGARLARPGVFIKKKKLANF